MVRYILFPSYLHVMLFFDKHHARSMIAQGVHSEAGLNALNLLTLLTFCFTTPKAEVGADVHGGAAQDVGHGGAVHTRQDICMSRELLIYVVAE